MAHRTDGYSAVRASDHGPGALSRALIDRVRQTWTEARTARDGRYAPLLTAVTVLARSARASGVAVVEVLRALNALTDLRLGGDPSLEWDSVRERLGQTAIASYYRDD